jgi:hypothetical protein
MIRWRLVFGAAMIAAGSSATFAKNPYPRQQAINAQVFRDLAAFNEAAGMPPIAIDFDRAIPGDDLAGQTQCCVAFQKVNAPLIVVRQDETYTPPGFRDLANPGEYALKATSGIQLLSPGGPRLGPGPDPAIEDDDISMIFNPPVAAVGFDHVSQYADGNSYTHVQVFDVAGNEIYAGTIEIGPDWERYGGRIISSIEPIANATTDFWGIVSASANIREIRIDERDDDSVNPDCNIGIDTLRFAPTRCGVYGDMTGDDRIDAADIMLVMLEWGDYSPKTGDTIRWSPADLDRNGTINGADILAMMAQAG